MLVFHALFTFSRASLLMPALRPGALRSCSSSSGYVGVNFFFVLSGFVLAYAYVEDGRMTTSAGRFWRARFARIYPMHLVGVLLALPLFVLGSTANHVQLAAVAKEGAIQVALSALLVQAWVPAHVFDLNGPSWSLSCEAFFYALFPLLVRLVGKLRVRGLVVAWRRRVGARARSAARAQRAGERARAHERARPGPPPQSADALAGLRHRGGERAAVPAWGPRQWSRAPIVAAATFVLILALLAESDRLPFALLHNGLLDPLWALLVFALAARGGDARGVGSDPFVRGGHASYSLYVLHKPLYFWMARAQGWRSCRGGVPRGVPGGSVAVSLVARRWVEENTLRRALGGGGGESRRARVGEERA